MIVNGGPMRSFMFKEIMEKGVGKSIETFYSISNEEEIEYRNIFRNLGS